MTSTRRGLRRLARFEGWSAMRHRNYRLFFAGQGLSLVGTWMMTVAQSWLILQLTGDPLLLGVVAAVQWTPAAVSRAPRSGSPGHWWESPQPPAIVELCVDALEFRPAVIVSGARPAAERAWLMSART